MYRSIDLRADLLALDVEFHSRHLASLSQRLLTYSRPRVGSCMVSFNQAADHSHALYIFRRSHELQ